MKLLSRLDRSHVVLTLLSANNPSQKEVNKSILKQFKRLQILDASGKLCGAMAESQTAEIQTAVSIGRRCLGLFSK